MKIITSIGRFLSGIIATASGFVTLLQNSTTNEIYKNMSPFYQHTISGILIALGLFLVSTSVIELINNLHNNKKTHRLKYQSKKFVKFFSNWYSRPGTLSVICYDLDWIKNGDSQEIYNKMIAKSNENKLNLFLASGLNTEPVLTLKQHGAIVYSVSKNIVDQYNFSCLSMMGNSAGRVIVRNKQKDKGDIVIIDEICNTYVTELLNTLLDEWRK